MMYFSILGLILLMSFCHQARSMTAEDFTNPRNKCRTSFPYVCDPNEILKSSERLKIGNLTEMTMSTVKCSKCDCEESKKGFYIAVAIVTNFSYNSLNTSEHAAEEKTFANELLQLWKPSPCGNDMLILIVSLKSKMIVSYGNVSKVNVPPSCTAEVVAGGRDKMSQGKISEALESVIMKVRTIYRNADSTSWPVCFGKSKSEQLSATAIVLIVLSIVVAIGIVVFLIWHINGQRQQRYLDYNPNRRIRFNSYAGNAEYGSRTDIDDAHGPRQRAPSTVTGEYAMWQGSVSEGTYDNPGFTSDTPRAV